MAGNNNETTTKFKVDISELKKAMQDAKRAVAVANSEFKEASSSMDDWTKSSDGLSAKLKQLDTTLKAQKTILGSLEAQYEAVVAEQGEGSKAADDLKIKINNQKAAINNTEKAITNYSESLEEVSEAEKTAAKTGKSVAEVLEDVGDEAEDASGGFTVLKGAVATFAGNMLTSFVGAIKNGISSLAGLATETREYRTELGKLETAFTTAGFTTEDATKTYKELYAVLGDEGQSVEAANMLAKLVDTEEELAEWTNIATGVYGTFGASLPIESLAEAANETSKTGAITGALADAINWAGVSEDDFQASLDSCTSEQERQALITETLNGLYSEAAEAYKETNKSVMDANKANSDYTDTMAAMGAKIEPVTTTLKAGFTGLLQEVLKLVDGVDMTAFTTKIEEGFNVLKNDVLPAVKNGFQWILDNKDALIAGLAGIAAGFLAFKVVTLIQGVTSAMQGMTIAQYALNLAMSLNPIGLLVAAITGLVAAFVVLLNSSESFRAFWVGLWENIKAAFDTAVNGIMIFFTETLPTTLTNTLNWIIEWSSNMIAKAKEMASSFLDSVISFFSQLPSQIWTWLSNVFSKIVEWSGNMIAKAKEMASSFLNSVISFFSQLPSKIWTWLSNVISKIVQWSSNMIAKAKEMASSFLNSVVNFIKQLPNKIWTWLVSTVSKVTTFGKNLAAKGKEAATGLLNSIVNIAKGIPDKMISIGSNVISGLWTGVSGAVSGLYENIKSALSGLVDRAKNALGINSPSKVFAAEVGKWIPEGIAVGIDKNAKSALSSMKDLAMDTIGAASAGINSTTSMSATGGVGGVVNNYTQIINSPKALSRLEIYRQSKNLLTYAGGGA